MVPKGAYPAAPNAPNDQAGDPPFATPDDFSTAGASPASSRYWQWIDSIIAKAADHGMAVMLSYTYLGYQGGHEGWYQDVLAQRNQQVLFDWGQWLGNRYRDAANVIWFGLGDYSPPAGSEGAARVRAIADGIKAAGAPPAVHGRAVGTGRPAWRGPWLRVDRGSEQLLWLWADGEGRGLRDGGSCLPGLTSQARVDGGGNVRIGEQHRTVLGRAVGHPSGPVLVGARRWNGRRRLRVA